MQTFNGQKSRNLYRFTHGFFLSGQNGSFSVIAALLLVVLVGMFAFVLNLCNLHMSKNKCQNAVEAAAMAGAVCLSDDDPESAVRKVLLENLFYDEYSDLPEGYTAEILIGYYDETGEYDFSGISDLGYKSFVEEENMPFDYPNSFFVGLTVEKKIILPDFIGDKEETPFRVTAVAYLKRYGMLSLGEEEDDGIHMIEFDNVGLVFPEGFPTFESMGIVHANNIIDFGVGSPSADEDSQVFAVNSITGIEGESPVSSVVVPEINWDELHSRADEVIDRGYFEREEQYINGNVYINRLGFFQIGFHDGVHDKIYYLDTTDFPDNTYIALRGKDDDMGVPSARAFTLVVGGDNVITCFYSIGEDYGFSGKVKLGGGHPDTAYIYTKGDIAFYNAIGNGLFPNINPDDDVPNILFQGVVLWAEGDVTLKTGNSSNYVVQVTHKVRVVSGGRINLLPGGQAFAVNDIFNGDFGPPCPPTVVRLGTL